MKRKNRGFDIGGPGVTINGDIVTDVDITIASILNGNVESLSTVFVNKGAVINGNITAENVVIDDAEVVGNIKAENTTLLLKRAVVKGDVDTKALVIDEGAVLNGKCSTREEREETTH